MYGALPVGAYLRITLNAYHGIFEGSLPLATIAVMVPAVVLLSSFRRRAGLLLTIRAGCPTDYAC